MKVLVLYFSGTGNTAYIGKYIGERLRDEGCTVQIASIETIDQSMIAKNDHLIFGFPVYACSVPEFIHNYLKEIPLSINKTVFIYCTKAVFSGSAIVQAQRIFRKKRYNIMGTADIHMPGSDGLAFVKKDSSMVQKIQKQDFRNIPQGDFLIEKLMRIQKSIELGEDIDKYKVNFQVRFIEKVVGHIVMKIYPIFESKFKKKFWVDEKCIKCKKCEKICPSHNIKVKDKVEFDHQCYLCMRCIHQCPAEAIQIGKKTQGKFRWKGPYGLLDPLKE